MAVASLSSRLTAQAVSFKHVTAAEKVRKAGIVVSNLAQRIARVVISILSYPFVKLAALFNLNKRNIQPAVDVEIPLQQQQTVAYEDKTTKCSASVTSASELGLLGLDSLAKGKAVSADVTTNSFLTVPSTQSKIDEDLVLAPEEVLWLINMFQEVVRKRVLFSEPSSLQDTGLRGVPHQSVAQIKKVRNTQQPWLRGVPHFGLKIKAVIETQPSQEKMPAPTFMGNLSSCLSSVGKSVGNCAIVSLQSMGDCARQMKQEAQAASQALTTTAVAVASEGIFQAKQGVKLTVQMAPKAVVITSAVSAINPSFVGNSSHMWAAAGSVSGLAPAQLRAAFLCVMMMGLLLNMVSNCSFIQEGVAKKGPSPDGVDLEKTERRAMQAQQLRLTQVNKRQVRQLNGHQTAHVRNHGGKKAFMNHGHKAGRR